MWSPLEVNEKAMEVMTACEKTEYLTLISEANGLIETANWNLEESTKKGLTLKEIAEKQNCSVEWIRATEKKALFKCKKGWIAMHGGPCGIKN